jgi:hypothetical protein
MQHSVNNSSAKSEVECRGHVGGSDPETMSPRGESLNGTRSGQTSPDLVSEHFLRAKEEAHKAGVL